MVMKLFAIECHAIRRQMRYDEQTHKFHMLKYARGHDKRHLRELVKLKVMCDKWNLL